MIPDYEKALHYTMWGQWDGLLILMVRTNDDILSKRIEQFLHAYHYSLDENKVIGTHEVLIQYIDHAMKDEPVLTIQI